MMSFDEFVQRVCGDDINPSYWQITLLQRLYELYPKVKDQEKILVLKARGGRTQIRLVDESLFDGEIAEEKDNNYLSISCFPADVKIGLDMASQPDFSSCMNPPNAKKRLKYAKNPMEIKELNRIICGGRKK